MVFPSAAVSLLKWFVVVTLRSCLAGDALYHWLPLQMAVFNRIQFLCLSEVLNKVLLTHNLVMEENNQVTLTVATPFVLESQPNFENKFSW